MKTFKFSLVLHSRENTDVFNTVDDNIYGIHRKRVNILYVSIFPSTLSWNTGTTYHGSCVVSRYTKHRTDGTTNTDMETPNSDFFLYYEFQAPVFNN